VKERLRSDFHLALITLFAVITVLGVTPFAIRRFVQGQVLAGAVDMLILLCICAGSAYAWRTGRTAGPAIFLAASYSIGCVAIAHIADFAGVLWVYPVLVANFMLSGRAPALLVSAAAIAGIALSDTALPELTHKLAFTATGAVVSLFSFVFASRTAVQRAQLESMALRDPLTGAGNRRGMEAELKIAMASSLRSGVPLGLLVFDIDHFKQVNDSLGHDAGDEVLVQIADVVRGLTRLGDRFFRMGGEEFVLLLPGATAAVLLEIAEKLRLAVEGGVQCRGRRITISIGATAFAPGENPGEWLARADAAMYEAKRSGRNRTVVRG
jgi:diguanylate cyclase (GGDEF)-like protein